MKSEWYTNKKQNGLKDMCNSFYNEDSSLDYDNSLTRRSSNYHKNKSSRKKMSTTGLMEFSK